MTVYVTIVVVPETTALLTEQLPVLEVRQLTVLPGLKVPLTVALAIAAPVLMFRTETVAMACQFLPDFLAEPVRFLMATVWFVTTPGAPLARE